VIAGSGKGFEIRKYRRFTITIVNAIDCGRIGKGVNLRPPAAAERDTATFRRLTATAPLLPRTVFGLGRCARGIADHW
jgi:hypothetical protein